MLRRAVRL
jgi:hypothetical protein